MLFSTAAFPINSFRGLGGEAFGGFLSAANGISADGRVIVGVSGIGTTFEAVRWTPEGVFGLGDLPGGSSFARATKASFNGSYIVGSSESSNGTEAFRWTVRNDRA
ncbi:MAG: hypothetical protein ACR2HJ_03460 [Fimbriimonadales bacterium]